MDSIDNKKIKVLYINHNAGWGGSEQSLFDIIKHIDKEKFEPILCVPEEGILAEKARELNVKTYVLKNYSWRWYYGGLIARLKFLMLTPQIILYLFKWKSFFKKIKPDIVHININRVIEQLWVTKFLKTKTILHFRDIPSKVRRPFWGGLKTFYYFANLADYWVANSKATYDDIKPHTNKEIKIINNLINLNEFDSKLHLKCSIEFDKNKKSVAMIGSLVPWKNQKDFIEVIKLLASDRKDVDFYIVGDGPDKPFLQDMVKQNNLSGCVKFIDFTQNVYNFYSGLSVYVHTMPHESFGRVFIEAMAAGKPVVAYNSGGAAGIVVNNETGFLIENNNIKQFAEKINILLDNEELAKEMGAKGRKRVEENYNSPVIIKQLESFYTEILNDR